MGRGGCCTPTTVLWVHKKLPQSTVKLVLPSNESYESKTGCNRTLATVLWVPLIFSDGKSIATQIEVKLIPSKYFVAFAFVLIFAGTDDLLHSCSHRYFTPNSTFAFAFVILKVTNSEIIILFRFALNSRCGNHPHPHKMRKLRPKLRPRRI